MVLEFKNIYKSFENKKVLIDCSFEVKSGCALGILGRNGAGKTTCIRILLDILKKDKGEILLDGKKLNRDEINFGYLPEERGLYLKKPIINQLIYLGTLKGLSKSEAKEQSISLLKRVGLNDVKNNKLETLSKGNAQKVQLIAALLANPQILVLDEPFSGLDPVNAQLLKEIIHEQSKGDKIILFSSHQMSYVEEFCDDIALLNDGKIILKGNLNEIKNNYPKNKLLIEPYSENYLNFLKKIDNVVSTSVLNNSIVVELDDEKNRSLILKQTAENSFLIDKFEVIKPSLEQIFIEKAGEKI